MEIKKHIQGTSSVSWSKRKIMYDTDSICGIPNRFRTTDCELLFINDKIIRFHMGVVYDDIICTNTINEYSSEYDYAYLFNGKVVAIGENRWRSGGMTAKFMDSNFAEKINKLQHGDIHNRDLYETIKTIDIQHEAIHLRRGQFIVLKEYTEPGIVVGTQDNVELIINYDPNTSTYNLWKNVYGIFTNLIQTNDIEEIYNSEQWTQI